MGRMTCNRKARYKQPHTWKSLSEMKKHFPFEILLLLLILPIISFTYLAVQIQAVEREQYINLESIVLLKAEQIENWLNG